MTGTLRLVAKGTRIIYTHTLDILMGSSIFPSPIDISFVLTGELAVLTVVGDSRAVALLRDGLSRTGSVHYMEISGPMPGLGG